MSATVLEPPAKAKRTPRNAPVVHTSPQPIYIDRRELAVAARLAFRATPSKSSLPILLYLLISADPDRPTALCFRGAGYDLAAMEAVVHLTEHDATDVSAVTGAWRAVTVEARTFVALVESIAASSKGGLLQAPVSLESDGLALTVRTDGQLYTSLGIPSEQFPPLPDLETNGDERIVKPIRLELPAGPLREAINSVAFAVASDVSRPQLCGINLSTDATGVRVTGASMSWFASRRIELIDSPTEWPEGDADVTLPAETMAAVAVAIDETGATHVDVVVTASQVQFTLPLSGMRLVSRRIDGMYPRIDKAIPTGGSRRVVLERDALQAALKRLMELRTNDNQVILDDGFETKEGDVPAGLTGVSTHLRVRASGWSGQGAEMIPATWTGDPGFSLAMDAKQLERALRAVTGRQISMAFNGPLQAVLITSPEVGEWTYVQQPQHRV